MDRPLLKGKIHAMAGLSYKIMIPFLIGYIPRDLIAPVSIYLICLIGHLMASATLHIHVWDSDWLPLIRKIDHTVIFLKIVSTYWLYINTVLINPNDYMLFCLFGGAFLGILSRVFYTDAPPAIIAIPYIIVGWSVLFDLDCLVNLIYNCPELFILTITGGLMYTTGGIVYSLRYPNPYPKIFGYHEIFHTFTTMANFLETYGIFRYAIPFHMKNI